MTRGKARAAARAHGLHPGGTPSTRSAGPPAALPPIAVADTAGSSGTNRTSAQLLRQLPHVHRADRLARRRR